MIRGIDSRTGEAVALRFKDGRIAERQAIPRQGDLPYLSSGWLDLQVNGYRGIDWNSDDLTLPQAEELCTLLRDRGTTRFLPTVITADPASMVRRIRTIAQFADASPVVADSVEGIHVEGPFIAGEDGPRGAHDRTATRDPDLEELQRWIKASGGRVRMVTLAPERRGAAAFIRRLRQRGIVPAIGHTAGSAEQIREAVEAGALVSTHLGNGLSDQIHRHHNPRWSQLATDDLAAGIIADGFHLPNTLLRVIARVKGPGRIVLVSDVAAPGGLPTGTHRWSGIDVEVSSEGKVSLTGTPYLAGAGHLLDRGVGVFLAASGLQLSQVIRTVTENPHRLLGNDTSRYSLDVGAAAEIVAFRLDEETGAVKVEQVAPKIGNLER